MTGSETIEYLDLDDLIRLAGVLVGEPPPVRDIGLLGAAVARPRTTVGGSDAYPDLWTKAAALLQSVVSSHALIDGNKRLGWLATAVFLEINGHSLAEAEQSEIYDLVMGVARGSTSLEEIASDLRSLTLHG
ncbi:MAG TPA: type II toxin-antitoxin system death-on-curing family toxin [Acidimicrobiales bacterium]|nr:type II toxin-antitoxin system death-on-curing family toxin [Acidimicrobiales bacterium]